jgi:hypothetical protein
MEKTIRIIRRIPLIDVEQIEEDGVNAIERMKVELAIELIHDLPKELFERLKEAQLDKFNYLRDTGQLEIEMILTI